MADSTFDVNQAIRSPLRYPGGKTRVAKLLAEHFPESHFDYREIFAGGGAVFFHKAPAKTNWINDLHPGLYALYVALRDNFDAFAKKCQDNRADGDERRERLFNECAEDRRLMRTTGDERLIARAFQYYYLNRTVWGGRVVFDKRRKSRLYFSNPDGWNNLDKKLKHLKKVSAKLQDVTITCQDYSECLQGATSDTFVYADPPYYRESNGHITNRLYDKSFDIECHQKLADALKDTPAKVMISYDDCSEVRTLYKGWKHIKKLEWKYSGTYAVSKEAKANGKKEEKVTGRELLILNY